MKTLSEKIIEQLQSKHDAFLGTKGEQQRQAFKRGLSWAIDTVETLTEIDKCEKEHEAEQLLIHSVVVPKGTLCKCKKEFTVYNDREGLDVCTLCGDSKLA